MITDGPITEAMVLDSLSNYNGFLPFFVTNAMQFTDSHVGYLLADGLAVLTQVAPIPLTLHGNGTHLNILNIGTSSESRKSEGIRMAVDLLREVNPRSLAPQLGSREVLFDIAQDNPRSLLVYPEGGDFLSVTRQGSYLNPVKMALTGMYDGMYTERATVKGRDASRSRLGPAPSAPQPPRISFIGGATPSQLDEYTDEGDWRGGFLARFFLMSVTRERTVLESQRVVMPPRYWHGTQTVSYLQSIDPMLKGGMPVGLCAGYDQKARAVYQDWCSDRSKAKKAFRISELAAPAWERASQLLERISLLLAWDCGRARTSGAFYLTEFEVGIAAKIVDLHLSSVLQVTRNIASTRAEKEVQRVYREIQEEPIDIGLLSARVGMIIDRSFLAILGTLIQRRRIAPISINGIQFYRRVEYTDPIPRFSSPPIATVQDIPTNVIPIDGRKKTAEIPAQASVGVPPSNQAMADEEDEAEYAMRRLLEQERG